MRIEDNKNLHLGVNVITTDISGLSILTYLVTYCNWGRIGHPATAAVLIWPLPIALRIKRMKFTTACTINWIRTYHSCCGSSMTRRILNFLGVVTWVCSTNPAEAAVCFTTLVMELKNPALLDWDDWGFLSGAREGAGAAGPVVGDLAGVGAVGEAWAGSGLCRSVM